MDQDLRFQFQFEGKGKVRGLEKGMMMMGCAVLDVKRFRFHLFRLGELACQLAISRLLQSQAPVSQLPLLSTRLQHPDNSVGT